MDKNLNSNLNKAKSGKRDEFYTQLSDIERELKNYKNHLKDKIIYCNCDDPRESNFFKYFSLNFEVLGLKKLITTCYKNQNPDLFSTQESEKAIYLEYNGDKNNNNIPDDNETIIYPLSGDGDFRSKECVELLKQADLVITNPPFSLFREYLAQLIEFDKKFIIIGSINAIPYKDVFQAIKNDKLWIGYGFKGGNAYFRTPHQNDFASGVYDTLTGLVKFRNVCWYTNLEIAKRYEDLILYKTYNPIDYPKYDNYDAINVDKTKDIPMDYKGEMGVPITFLDKYNPDQFEIIGMDRELMYNLKGKVSRFFVNGSEMYARIVIRNKRL